MRKAVLLPGLCGAVAAQPWREGKPPPIFVIAGADASIDLRSRCAGHELWRLALLSAPGPAA